MIRHHGAALRALLVAGDVALALAVLVAVSQLRYGSAWEGTWEALLPQQPALVAGVYAAAWVGLLWLHGAYRPRAHWSIASETRGVLLAMAWMAIGSAALLFLVKLEDVSRLFLLALFAVQALLTIALRATIRVAFRVIRRRGRNYRNVLVLGTGRAGLAFARQLEGHSELGLRVEGFLGDPVEQLPARWPYLGALDALQDVLHARVVDEVAVCLPFKEWHLIDAIVRLCEDEGKIVRIPMEMPTVTVATGHVEDLDGTPVISLVPGPDRVIALAAKRALDIVGSALGLLVLAPLFAAVALAILVKDGRPILFRQERAGLHGRRFRIVKFRTMQRDADARRAELRAFNEVEGNASFKMTNDPRITPLGRFLRRTSIDELPQLWNVLVGDMSLVGPRPHPLDDVAGYDVWHRRRLSMKPGITGLWQIGGRRETDFNRWVEQDLQYIDRWSLWLDIRVLLGTIPALIRAEGR